MSESDVHRSQIKSRPRAVRVELFDYIYTGDQSVIQFEIIINVCFI